MTTTNGRAAGNPGAARPLRSGGGPSGHVECLGDARQDSAHDDQGDTDDCPAQLLARAGLVEPQDTQRGGDQDAELGKREAGARTQVVGVELEQQDRGTPQDAVEDGGPWIAKKAPQ